MMYVLDRPLPGRKIWNDHIRTVMFFLCITVYLIDFLYNLKINCEWQKQIAFLK